MFTDTISFSSPQYSGGGRISVYEVIKSCQLLGNIKYIWVLFKVHLRVEDSEDWYMLMTIPVKPLSAEPDIKAGNVLSELQGSFSIRVAARNVAGLGSTSELKLELQG